MSKTTAGAQAFYCQSNLILESVQWFKKTPGGMNSVPDIIKQVAEDACWDMRQLWNGQVSCAPQQKQT